MASTAESQDYKTVTGYPAQPAGEVAAGYPVATAYDAYPYAAPAAPPLPDDDRSCRRWNRKSAACVLLLFFIGMFIILRIFLTHYPEFRVDSATVYPLNVTGSELTATWDLTLLVTNPSHMSRMHYDQLQASLFYAYKDDDDDDDELRLGTSSLAPFILDKRNQTRVHLKLVTVNEYVGDDVAKQISDEKVGGRVRFIVRVEFGFGFELWSYLLQVCCDPVEFGFSPNNNGTGSLTGQSKKCQVGFSLPL